MSQKMTECTSPGCGPVSPYRVEQQNEIIFIPTDNGTVRVECTVYAAFCKNCGGSVYPPAIVAKNRKIYAAIKEKYPPNIHYSELAKKPTA